jgi:hypothetical protein
MRVEIQIAGWISLNALTSDAHDIIPANWDGCPEQTHGYRWLFKFNPEKQGLLTQDNASIGVIP